MEEIVFELLNVRLQRNIRLLEEIQQKGENLPGAEQLAMTCTLLEHWIRKSGESGPAMEEAQSNLAEIVALLSRIRHTLRWKIGNRVIGFLEALLPWKKSNNNAFTRMDDLLSKVESSLKDREVPLNPYKFSALNGQFLQPALFPGVQETRKGKVAIIVLNRNGEEHLQKFFSSFITFNSYQDYEFIVVDHDSDDRSIEIIESNRQKINIRLLPFSSNLTYSYSNNYAASQSDAEFLFFLNNDIIFDQDVIESMVDLMKQYPEAGIVAPCLFYPDEHFRRSETLQHSGIRFIYRQKRLEHISYAETDPPSFYVLKYKYSHLFRDTIIPVNSHEPGPGISFHPAICAAAMLCRRDDFLLAGGFDENYIYGYEDVDISLVFQKKLGKKLILANDLGMIHNESYTRKKEGLYKSSLKIHNLLMLTHRFGYYMRINYLMDLYSGRRSWTSQHPIVAVITGTDKPESRGTEDKLRFLTALFTHHLEWEARVISSSELEVGIGEADIAIYLDRNLPVKHHPGAKDTLISLTWGDEGKQGFSFEKAYGKIFGELSSPEPDLGMTLKSQDYPDPDPFRKFILDRVENHINIAFKSPSDPGNPGDADISLLIEYIEKTLIDDPCSFRTDLPGHWYDYGTLSDQVVISFPGQRIYYPQPGQINVLWLTPGWSEYDISLVDFYDLIIIEEGIENLSLFENDRNYSRKILRSAIFNDLRQKNTAIAGIQQIFEALRSIHREKAGI